MKVAVWVSNKDEPQFEGEEIIGIWMKNMLDGIEREVEWEGGRGPRAWHHLCVSINANAHRLLGVDQSEVVVNKTDAFLKDMTNNYNESASNIRIMAGIGQGNVLMRSLFGK